MSVRILIVDDNAINMKLAADVLAGPDCEVACAGDAEQALALLAASLPDLILMDLAMPGTDGLTLTRRLKEDERYRRVPIVALTASAMKGDDLRALAAGCEGYITKPIDTRRFKQKVFGHLDATARGVGARATMEADAPEPRVLVVDDSSRNRKLLRIGLEAERCEVVEATDGMDALEVLGCETVDAVVSDVLMPRMDGFRLCRELRRSGQPYANLPFLLYTSTYDSSQGRQLASSVGADDYLTRPASARDLLRAIREAQARAATREPPADTPRQQDAEVLEQYNSALVRKLESRNLEAQQTLAQLQEAHEHILELNRFLELRVEQRTAALQAANHELEAFAYAVAHDLRAPLHQIVGFADLMRDPEVADKAVDRAECVAHMGSAARRMDRLILDLLDFARTALVELELHDVDLERTLDEALDILRGELRGRSIKWTRAPLPRARGNPALVRQVFVNLLSNAIKYTRSRPEARIEVGSRGGRTEELVVFVRDNGIGFDMQHAPQLFGPFKRLGTARDYEGVGLGLAHVQRIVSRHGGRVWAEGGVGEGATFYFSLPSPEFPHPAGP